MIKNKNIVISKFSYEEINPIYENSKWSWNRNIDFSIIKNNKVVKYSTILILVVAVSTVVALSANISHKPLSIKRDSPLENTPALSSKSVTKYDDTLVDLEKGTVRGFKMTSREGREFLAFQGIPYAKPPKGKLKFQPAEEAEAWNGILNATEFGPICLQRSKGVFTGAEDCLHVNVYTPKKLEELLKRPNLPVMVYIHGGGASGSSRRNTGEYFMDEDVVLVSFNYRMGILGNLNTNDSFARGNQGLRDQIKALEWVKNNIQKFGGNNSKVTLFGNSFGSMAIATHMISPMTKGLFHQVICQSGQAIFPELLQQNPVKYAFTLGEMLNCNATNTSELISCFQNADPETFIDFSRKVKREDENPMSMSISSNVFTTSVDPQLTGVDETDVYLPQEAIKLIMSGKTKSMPAIFGVNSGEGLMQSVSIFSSSELTKKFNEDWDIVASGALVLPINASRTNFVTSAKEFYFGGQNISKSTMNNLTDIFSDRLGTHPAHVSAFYQKQANLPSQNVYMYYFTKQVESSYLTFGNFTEQERKELGPAHADEVQFLFPYPPFPLIPLDSPNFNFSRKMIKLWSSFAKSGLPDSSWLPIEGKPFDYFQLNDDTKMVNFLGERMNFWDSYNLTDIYIY